MVKLNPEKIVADALRLPRESRAFLVERLLESLGFEEDFPVSDQWMDEIRRRCKEIDAGGVDMIAADNAIESIRRGLGQ